MKEERKEGRKEREGCRKGQQEGSSSWFIEGMEERHRVGGEVQVVY